MADNYLISAFLSTSAAAQRIWKRAVEVASGIYADGVCLVDSAGNVADLSEPLLVRDYADGTSDYSSLAINEVTTGDRTIIVGVPSQTTRVFEFFLTSDADEIVTPKFGSATKSMMNMTKGVPVNLSERGRPVWEGAPGEAFILNKAGGTANIRGHVKYKTSP